VPLEITQLSDLFLLTAFFPPRKSPFAEWNSTAATIVPILFLKLDDLNPSQGRWSWIRGFQLESARYSRFCPATKAKSFPLWDINLHLLELLPVIYGTSYLSKSSEGRSSQRFGSKRLNSIGSRAGSNANFPSRDIIRWLLWWIWNGNSPCPCLVFLDRITIEVEDIVMFMGEKTLEQTCCT